MRPRVLLVLAVLAGACGAETPAPSPPDVPAPVAPQPLSGAAATAAPTAGVEPMAGAPAPVPAAVCESCELDECEAGLRCHEGRCLPMCNPDLGVSMACHEAFGIALPTSDPRYTCVDAGVCLPVEPCP